MSFLLAIYNKAAHEDVLLPAINNADFQVTLSSSKFEISKDITLGLEILDGKWRFRKTAGCRIAKDGSDWVEKPLASGDILTIDCAHNHFTVLVTRQSSHIGSMEKFDTMRLGELVQTSYVHLFQQPHRRAGGSLHQRCLPQRQADQGPVGAAVR